MDDTKTIQQKTVETLQIASKWEQENSLKISDVSVVETCILHYCIIDERNNEKQKLKWETRMRTLHVTL